MLELSELGADSDRKREKGLKLSELGADSDRKKEKGVGDVQTRGWLGQKKEPLLNRSIKQNHREISRYNALLTYNRYYCSCQKGYMVLFNFELFMNYSKMNEDSFVFRKIRQFLNEPP
jgi:hypothetical protein